MARADENHELEELYRILMDGCLDFVPRGEHHLRGVYTFVSERHPDLCDDRYLCSASCKSGYSSPEWQHVVRAVLKNVRARGGPITKGAVRGRWIFGPLTAAQAEPRTTAVEGRVLLRLHKVKERRPAIVRAKKCAVRAATGRLMCEACDFDFASVYGPLGDGFAECHHRIPLAELDGETHTQPEDLAIVCANCHRMLHRSRPMLSVEELRRVVLAWR